MTETKPEYYKPYPVVPAQPQKQVIVFPYPPTLEIDGALYETLDYMTLVKLVYDLRNRVNELEKGRKE